MRSSAIAILVLLLAGCAAPIPEVDPDYRAQIEQWRARRLEGLQSPDGWLTLAGLYWLHPGINRVGSDPSGEVVLPADAAPPLAATLELEENGTVVARAASDVTLLLDGEPFVEAALAPDSAGEPDVVTLGRLQLYVIERSAGTGVRVRDTGSPRLRDFPGLEYFPVDPSFRVAATLEPYEEGLREVAVPTVTGAPTTMLSPGVLRFELESESLTLEPYVSRPEDTEYFLIFRDRTSGDTTYGGGRFLGTEAAGADGKTIVDFNYAYNPPCAFTPYATCPLPPPQNALDVAVRAGEKLEGGGGH
jgi:uncharacterized protein (DUF1684 family)